MSLKKHSLTFLLALSLSLLASCSKNSSGSEAGSLPLFSDVKEDNSLPVAVSSAATADILEQEDDAKVFTETTVSTSYSSSSSEQASADASVFDLKSVFSDDDTETEHSIKSAVIEAIECVSRRYSDSAAYDLLDLDVLYYWDNGSLSDRDTMFGYIDDTYGISALTFQDIDIVDLQITDILPAESSMYSDMSDFLYNDGSLRISADYPRFSDALKDLNIQDVYCCNIKATKLSYTIIGNNDNNAPSSEGLFPIQKTSSVKMFVIRRNDKWVLDLPLTSLYMKYLALAPEISYINDDLELVEDNTTIDAITKSDVTDAVKSFLLNFNSAIRNANADYVYDTLNLETLYYLENRSLPSSAAEGVSYFVNTLNIGSGTPSGYEYSKWNILDIAPVSNARFAQMYDFLYNDAIKEISNDYPLFSDVKKALGISDVWCCSVEGTVSPDPDISFNAYVKPKPVVNELHLYIFKRGADWFVDYTYSSFFDTSL